MHAGSTVADPMASHTALNGAILSIEGARTHAHGIITGAVAVFRAFQRAQPGVDRSRAGAAPDQFAPTMQLLGSYTVQLGCATGFLPALAKNKRAACHEFAGSIPGGRAAAGAGLFFVFPLGFFQERKSEHHLDRFISWPPPCRRRHLTTQRWSWAWEGLSACRVCA